MLNHVMIQKNAKGGVIMGILFEARQEILAGLGLIAEEAIVERVAVGVFFTGIKLSTGAGGLCFTPVKEVPEAVCCPSSAGRIRDPRKIQGTGVLSLLDDLDSREPLRRAMGIAALNALSAEYWSRNVPDDYEIIRNTDAQDLIEMKPDQKVAVIGALVPVMQKLKRRGGTWWVVEQDPRTLREEEMDHFVPASQADEVISCADVLVVTGVTLFNHTLEGILRKARKEADICVMGPTAGMLPGPLFSRGVRVIGGIWVRRPDELLDVLAAGGSGYHIFDDLAERIVLVRK
jgi:uncharacterized protein (DUF4213/DUF364 family)